MVTENSPGTSIKFVVDAEKAGRRLDLYLAEQVAELSRSRVQKLVEDGLVHLNGEPCSVKNYRLQNGDQLELSIPDPVETYVEPENIRLDIVYEDDCLLVINKPRGMVVHPAPGHAKGTLVNALLSYCRDLSGIGGVMRPGIVHRLDKDTSGLLLVAKNDFAHQSLSNQLKSRKLRREYIALVSGNIKPKVGRIEAPVGRHPLHRKKMAVVSGGREAVTAYRVLKYYDGYSLLQLKLETGRTHQIRVHLAHLGYPVVGDTLYGRGSAGNLPHELKIPHALHARRIAFIHPRSDEMLEFSVPIPPVFQKTLLQLKS